MAIRAEEKELLIDTGREIGTAMLEAAINSAPSIEIMHNQIFTLRRAAIHILAMTAYNDERLGGANADDCLEEISTEIENELEFARRCENEAQLDLFVPGVSH